ncbi:uncharacterized protein PITG_06346 [Phytophthora infestans T30-4]|uniref:Coiled-coil domain-containing protein 84 n=1 Tax=Phytophthora infestans (strain T30-4) TaxID=403677 RepID=D0N4M6_PHYIT|nr:uncharacterized protein PITG_06346 [Phytophthora infestans T30-4]EEY69834.1 conserved hypothetical protein [Phytophthora infestans T30-4]|eukprot:XP_002998481.1 conserved hypothetical protein [Phytophthora infestans T30-4]
MAAEDDVVVEAPYCVVCRRSSAGKWRKHVFSRSHQHAAQQFFLHQVTRLQAVLNATNASEWRRCVFCDVALGTADAPAHFGGDAHRKQVEAFCRHHRCDADRQMRPQLCLNAAQRREQLEVAHAAREADAVEETPADEVPTRKQQEALLGPLGTGASRCKTLTSSEGVLQNPLGRHEGKRVWGGGMVTLRKREWIPWAIDQLVKEEQADHPEFQQTGADYAPFAHRVTELAKGEGLSSISSVTWGASVGNVHTAAVPPWMVQTEEEYKQCNRREQETPSPALLTLKNDKVEVKEKKRRDIFSKLQAKSECGPDWLPNFGGVWQEGPRSKTKQAFRKATDAAKKPHPKAYNPLKTAKKQLLLAQKERLRAKMAARRRQ